jgi:hypothetical protein
VFSRWVRRSAANHEGYTECFTCRKWKPWKSMDAGHFRSRRHMATRWEELNVKPQCKGCNMPPNPGEAYLFGKRLNEDYGPGTADSLIAASRAIAKWPEHELKAEIKRIQALIQSID